MTDRMRAVEEAVDSEWRPTREIAERAGLEPNHDNVSAAGRRLRALAHQGRIEWSEERFDGGRGRHTRDVWRRRR